MFIEPIFEGHIFLMADYYNTMVQYLWVFQPDPRWPPVQVRQLVNFNWGPFLIQMS